MDIVPEIYATMHAKKKTVFLHLLYSLLQLLIRL